MRWKIYYGDFSTYDDTDGLPHAAPGLNAQIITQADVEHGYSVLWKHDFYWWEPQEAIWRGGDQFGLFDYLQRPGPRKVLFGRTIPYDDLMILLDLTTRDPDLPLKTGWRPEETRP